MLAENIAERGGGRRQADACQARQQSYARFSATDVKGFYLNLVLGQKTEGPSLPTSRVPLIVCKELSSETAMICEPISSCA